MVSFMIQLRYLKDASLAVDADRGNHFGFQAIGERNHRKSL
jgi:hypothetical protein